MSNTETGNEILISAVKPLSLIALACNKADKTAATSASNAVSPVHAADVRQTIVTAG
jgi:hypothetical protein